jgi:hypothetical protein
MGYDVLNVQSCRNTRTNKIKTEITHEHRNTFLKKGADSIVCKSSDQGR